MVLMELQALLVQQVRQDQPVQLVPRDLVFQVLLVQLAPQVQQVSALQARLVPLVVQVPQVTLEALVLLELQVLPVKREPLELLVLLDKPALPDLRVLDCKVLLVPLEIPDQQALLV